MVITRFTIGSCINTVERIKKYIFILIEIALHSHKYYISFHEYIFMYIWKKTDLEYWFSFIWDMRLFKNIPGIKNWHICFFKIFEKFWSVRFILSRKYWTSSSVVLSRSWVDIKWLCGHFHNNHPCPMMLLFRTYSLRYVCNFEAFASKSSCLKDISRLIRRISIS